MTNFKFMNGEFIVLDTETTGLDTKNDRIIEIGCVKLSSELKIIDQYQQYVNPNYEMNNDALAVHGQSKEFLSKYPLFKEIIPSFLSFIGKGHLIAHNAKFDINIINTELVRNGYNKLDNEFTDTLYLARKKFPGSQVNLDALCTKLNITNNRQLHGALEDAYILANVYIALIKMQSDHILKFNIQNYDWSARKPRYEYLQMVKK